MKPAPVQSQHRAPAALRIAMRMLCHVAPPLAARIAGDIFRGTRRRPTRAQERDLLEGADVFDLHHHGRRVRVYTWGEGPTVLLQHGWGSNAARMASFVPSLLDVGFSVVALDSTGHGASSGRRSSLLEMTEDALAVIERVGGVEAVVGHSMGAMVVARVLRARPLAAVVLLAPPAEMRVYSDVFAREIGLTDRVHRAMIARFERKARIRWSDLTAEAMAPERDTPALIVSDEDDRDAPREHALRWMDAWRGSVTPLLTEGLGHRRVVTDEAVVRRCTRWLAANVLGDVDREDDDEVSDRGTGRAVVRSGR